MCVVACLLQLRILLHFCAYGSHQDFFGVARTTHASALDHYNIASICSIAIYWALYISCIPVAARMARLSLHPVPEHKSEANDFCFLWAPSKTTQTWTSEAFLPLHWLVWRRRAVFWEKQNLTAAGDGEQEAQSWGCEISHGPHICREEEKHSEWWSDGCSTV